jgi:hypothetical protein
MVLENGYEIVPVRIEKFWMRYPNGRIDVKIIHQDGSRYIVQCDIYKDLQDMIPFASDFAEEIRSNNNRFPLENCVTSAIGRALHTCGISKFSEGIPRPSAEEMRRVNLTVVPAAANDDFMLVGDTLDGVIDQVLTNTAPPESPKCNHGYMLAKNGINKKTNKPYSGFVCGSKTNPCNAIWN